GVVFDHVVDGGADRGDVGLGAPGSSYRACPIRSLALAHRMPPPLWEGARRLAQRVECAEDHAVDVDGGQAAAYDLIGDACWPRLVPNGERSRGPRYVFPL